MKPDVILTVRFLTESEGGRNAPVEGKFYACPLFLEGESQGFDCRIPLDGRRLELGEIYEVSATFLDRDTVLPRLKIGTKLRLWEGRYIGDGHVIEIVGQGTA